MKRVLVTGGLGYLGAQISTYLTQVGYDVHVLDSVCASPGSGFVVPHQNIIVGDIRDDRIVAELAQKKIDAVIHLVSLDHHKSESASIELVNAINVQSTWRLLDGLTKSGLEKFIYFSTIHVYGDLPKEKIGEEQKTNPKNIYGLTHLLSEEICRLYNHKSATRCVSVRLSNSYGHPVFPGNNCWWLVINDLCKMAFEKNEIRLQSDGSPLRDFVHGQDICRAIETLLKSNNQDLNFPVYHVASGQTLSILELATLVKQVYEDRYGKKIAVELPSGASATEVDSKKYSFDISRLSHLGFVPQINLGQGIDALFSYLEKTKQ